MEKEEEQYRKKLVKNIQMLATLVATATYAAAFNPPGGVWQGIHHDAAATGRQNYLPGDPILRSTDHGRYVVFFYCNAAAFAFSLAVVVLTLLVTARSEIKDRVIKEEGFFLVILMSLMLVAMSALAAAYGAGVCQDKQTSVAYCLLVPGPLILFIVQIIMFAIRLLGGCGGSANADPDQKKDYDAQEEKRFGKLMVPLSMFALTITYVAGLSTPGGFWDSAEGGHRPGDAILKDRLHGDKALGWFLLSNTFAFAASLYGAVVSIVVRKKILLVRSAAPVNIILVVFFLLGGLLSAYCNGSSRGRSSITWRILTIVTEVTMGYVVVTVVFHAVFKKMKKPSGHAVDLVQPDFRCGVHPWVANGVSILMGLDRSTAANVPEHRQAHKLVQLMAGLAVAITYQAGLYPPGGVWPANADGHTAGDPILQTNYGRRYKGFHYCNSVSFVASLLVLFLAPKDALHEHHALEAAMLLDMLGLIGAYAIGSCRDQVSTLYIVGLAGAAMVYVVVHVSYFTLGDDSTPAAPCCDRGANKEEVEKNKEEVEKMGGRFLLFAILVASITYQAGLTPPGGFLLQDDAQSGHLAGDPVLQYNYPRRYRTFMYCNSVSFMLSIVLILLLVNPKQYRPAIQSHALSVCSAVSYICLMGAFAAGSTQHMKGSMHIFGLTVLAFVVCLLLPLLKPPNKQSTPNGSGGSNPDPNMVASGAGTPAPLITEDNQAPLGQRGQDKDVEGQKGTTSEEEEKKKEKTSVYLVTLAILVASATYPGGLDPPGGSWQSSSNGHVAGNSMMHDNRWQRYLAFFFGNTASFLASIVLIHMLLLAVVRLDLNNELQDLYRKGIKGLVSLQCLGVLVAYAAGSSRHWKTSVYTGALVFPVLAFVAVHVRLSTWRKGSNNNTQSEGKDDAQQTAQ